jgi:hypothetical protein
VSAAPGGSTTQVQFNNAGAFGGDSNFAWDNTNKQLYLGGTGGGSGKRFYIASADVRAIEVYSNQTTVSDATVHIYQQATASNVHGLRVETTNTSSNPRFTGQFINADNANNAAAVYAQATIGQAFSASVSGNGGRCFVGTNSASTGNPLNAIFSGQASNAASVGACVFYGRNDANSGGTVAYFERNSNRTNATVDQIQFRHNTSGTPAAGFGSSLYFFAESSTTTDSDLARIDVVWSTATHASRTSYIAFQTVNNASALTERLRIEGGGTLIQTVESALTNTQANVLTVKHNSTGTPAAFFGSRILFQLESATVVDRDAAAIDAYWSTATDASRSSRLVFSTVNSGVLTSRLSVYNTGLLVQSVDTAVTNTVDHFLLTSLNSSGTPAANYGTGILISLKSATVNDRNAVSIDGIWTDATDATRTSAFQVRTVSSGGALTTRLTVGATAVNLASGVNLQINSTQVVTSRRTGWAAATGTPTRTTFDTTTVTLPQLAERVKALLDDLITHGLIGT